MDTTATVEGKAKTRNGVKRLIFVIISILIEVLFVLSIIIKFNEHAEWISIATRVLALLLVLVIYGGGDNKSASIKMPWIILILLAPLLGLSLYLMIGLNAYTAGMRKRFRGIDAILLPKLRHDSNLTRSMAEEEMPFSGVSSYVEQYSAYPPYRNTDVEYYSEASDGLEAQLREMRKAKDFIFMEYHAIEDAESFHRIEEVLVAKVKEGVEVRLFYDDMGSIGFITTDFVRRMNQQGIKCRVFNPFAPGLNIFLNNRDHRKITVIDGKVGFTGGYNLANEYFNLTHPYGYWKDTGVRLEGDAVRSLTITFLEMWNAIRGNDIYDEDFGRYLKVHDYEAREGGVVQPYADSPMQGEHVGECVYAAVARGAKKYAWFVTPYLIITDEMNYVLGMAAKNGVDVRIITPGIPDKKLVYSVTRSYYAALVKNGVRIYEYTPGFCHCKMSVADDAVATCGTINLDYRSLYHHFENGCLLFQKQAVHDIRKDFEDMFAQSEEVTEKYRSGLSSHLRFGQLLLRLIAPLL